MYIVLELQKASKTEGSVGSLVYSFDDFKQAESKYYTILSYAAVSQLFLHGAYMFSEEGNMIYNKQYIYDPQPEPEPEPKPEPVEEAAPEQEAEEPAVEEVEETEPEEEQ